MKLSLCLPTHHVDVGELMSGAGIMAVASVAEQAGFDAVTVTEHPFPGDAWLAAGGHHALDPFVALSFAAAGTDRIGLQTNLLIAAYRNPFLAAKAVASLDVASGGRVVVGIGAGYLEAEYHALGVAMEERNELTDEAITAMRAAWAGRSVVATGRHWKAEGNTMLPRPVHEGGPPIWIGGNAARAMRRAVEVGDGWVPMLAPAAFSARVRSRAIGSVAELGARVDEARAYAATVGREAPLGIGFSLPGADMNASARDGVSRAVEAVPALAEAGVTALNVGLPGRSVAELAANVEWFAAAHLGPIRAL